MGIVEQAIVGRVLSQEALERAVEYGVPVLLESVADAVTYLVEQDDVDQRMCRCPINNLKAAVTHTQAACPLHGYGEIHRAASQVLRETVESMRRSATVLRQAADERGGT